MTICGFYLLTLLAVLGYRMSNVASTTTSPQLRYGASCGETTQCLTSDAVCNTFNICACDDTHYYDMANDTCTEKVDYGANCTDITGCITSNAICNGSGICACNDTHYYYTANDTCIQEQVFGGACSETSQCDTSDSNMECIQTTADKKCLCKDGSYRPNTSCVQFNTFNLAISDTSSTRPNNIGVIWTNDNVPGGYTVSYTVDWSPGSTGAVTTTQKNYNIPSLSAGIQYTVTVALHISLNGRSQQVETKNKIFMTKQAFGGACSDTSPCDTASDSNIACVQTTAGKRCLCKNGWYKPSTSCVQFNTFKLAISDISTTGLDNIGVTWTNDNVPGGYTVSYTVDWSPGSTRAMTTTQKKYNIPSLSAGTQYTVTVALHISLNGRSQQVETKNKLFTTKQAFGGVCSDTSPCDTASDSNIACVQTTAGKKCLCKNGWYKPSTSCVQFNTFNLAISDTSSTGQDNIGVTWTNDNVPGGYTVSYTVDWSPGSTGAVTTTQKNYNIPSLSAGIQYTVTVALHISLNGRSQQVETKDKLFTTSVGYNDFCTQQILCFDANSNCSSGRCRCDLGYYRNTICTSIEQLRPTSVTADVHNTSTMTASWAAPSNAIITGYEVSVIPGDITPISVGRDIRTTPITGLTPGRQYTVSVKTKITYLQGRHEMTDAVPAATKRTPPASILGLDSKTNRTAPDITILFSKAEGDADKYIVTLIGRDGDAYNQRYEPLHGSGQDLISVVFTGVVPAVSYTLIIQTQSGTLLSSPYTTEIRAQVEPAGRVTNLKSFDNTSRSVAVEWNRPRQPNGDIYEYIVDVTTANPFMCVKRVIINCTECSRTTTMPQMQVECTTTMAVLISQADIENVGHVIQHNITDLNPATPYSVIVVAVNQEGPGTSDQVNLYTPGEAPLQTEIIKSVRKGTEQSETPSLLICPRCLHDGTNGQVNKTGLIVCRKDNSGQAGNRRQTTSAEDYDNMANWNAANAVDFGIPYRATRDNWLDGLGGKSSLRFTLGNEDCSGNTTSLFCNGKLPTGETFIVYAFSCTNYGCTTSNRIEISTSAQVPVAAVVGGVVAAVVVILVVIGIFIILRRKKAQRERPKKNRDQVIAKFHADQNNIYEEIPVAQMVTVDSSRSNEGYVNYVPGQYSRDTDNTYDQLATYQNVDNHVYGRITTETRFK